MKFKIIITLLFFLSCSVILLQAQELKTIKGTVQDTNGFVLSGVIVSVKETNQTTQTDDNGNFELQIPDKNIFSIICIYAGYDTLERQIDLDKDNIHDLFMSVKENSTVLDEVSLFID